MAWSGSDDELEQARRVWVRLSQGRAAQLRRTGWRHYVRSGSTSVGVPGYLDAYVGRIVSAAERLHNVSLECRPALEVIDTYGADVDALLYVDPPYPSVVRGGSHCSSSYRHELRGEDQHAELLDRIRGVAAQVAVSGYRNPLYDRMLADWNITQMAAYTGTGNHRAEASNVRSEIVWTNFEPAQPLLISAE
jgi:DNA adenine methylase